MLAARRDVPRIAGAELLRDLLPVGAVLAAVPGVHSAVEPVRAAVDPGRKAAVGPDAVHKLYGGDNGGLHRGSRCGEQRTHHEGAGGLGRWHGVDFIGRRDDRSRRGRDGACRGGSVGLLRGLQRRHGGCCCRVRGLRGVRRLLRGDGCLRRGRGGFGCRLGGGLCLLRGQGGFGGRLFCWGRVFRCRGGVSRRGRLRLGLGFRGRRVRVGGRNHRRRLRRGGQLVRRKDSVGHACRHTTGQQHSQQTFFHVRFLLCRFPARGLSPHRVNWEYTVRRPRNTSRAAVCQKVTKKDASRSKNGMRLFFYSLLHGRGRACPALHLSASARLWDTCGPGMPGPYNLCNGKMRCCGRLAGDQWSPLQSLGPFTPPSPASHSRRSRRSYRCPRG